MPKQISKLLFHKQHIIINQDVVSFYFPHNKEQNQTFHPNRAHIHYIYSKKIHLKCNSTKFKLLLTQIVERKRK